ATEAPNDHHDKGVDDDIQIHAWIDGPHWCGNHTPQPPEPGAKGKHARIEQAHVDPQGANHLTILGGGTDDAAEAGAVEKNVEADHSHKAAGQENEDTITGEQPTENGHRPVETWGP